MTAAEPAPTAFDEDPLGRRIGAALIDLVLLAGLGLILVLTVGGYSFAGASFSMSLSWVWSLLYLVLILLYFFAAEAATRQSVGKRLLGLQVLRADGRRPSTPAIAGRTLLRIVDWLPLLYLVGFIVMLATGRRRQRVGDLAAGTAVGRALPGQRRGLAVALLVLVLAAAAGLFAYRATAWEGTKTYQGHGIRFDYPGSWDESELGSIDSGGGAQELWKTAVGVGRYDLVGVTAYRLPAPMTPEQLGAVTTDVTGLARNMFERNGGALRAGPQEVTVGGMPGFRLAGTMRANGVQTERTDLFLFDGSTEYQLECVSTAGRTAEVARACDQVQRSFTRTSG
jgi:uncharacterized RDD family membrane protein YckC